jgi:hypothetical protein
MHTLAHYKEIVEQDFTRQGYPIPDGFAITYNAETQLVKVFLNGESYNNLKEPDDLIMSQWQNGKWEDK